MKTAMQLLLEKFDRMPEYLFATYLKVNRDGLLEKEKEQIIEAHTNGHNDSYEYHFLKNSANEISLRNGEEYYNQTYNQNK